jgi:preprotein translocase subunit SecF
LSLVVCSIIVIIIRGLNLGLDFTGGTQIQLHYEQAIDPAVIRNTLAPSEFKAATIQNYGSNQELLVRYKKISESHSLQESGSVAALSKLLPEAKVVRVEFIGPQVGKVLITNGILAILISLLAIMAYIALRFEYRFAISAALSLVHDPIIILGFFALTQVEFNLIALAGILTTLGYSLNDTIVVYDRARENFRKLLKLSSYDIFNLSINQTLSRTIMTSSLSLTIVAVLAIFGGQMLFGFAIAMIIGIIIGTYSSIYVAGALAIMFGLEHKRL